MQSLCEDFVSSFQGDEKRVGQLRKIMTILFP
jgi:hypothetical protein